MAEPIGDGVDDTYPEATLGSGGAAIVVGIVAMPADVDEPPGRDGDHDAAREDHPQDIIPEPQCQENDPSDQHERVEHKSQLTHASPHFIG